MRRFEYLKTSYLQKLLKSYAEIARRLRPMQTVRDSRVSTTIYWSLPSMCFGPDLKFLSSFFLFRVLSLSLQACTKCPWTSSDFTYAREDGNSGAVADVRFTSLQSIRAMTTSASLLEHLLPLQFVFPTRGQNREISSSSLLL